MKSASPIKRRKSRQIMVGDVPIGGDAPIAVQSMTNTETRDVEATVAQIQRLQEAGAHVEYLYNRGELVADNVDDLRNNDDPVIRYRRA